ncbi:hypothetical protein F7734_36090 [Scytonema sp. UIC 10036]|uniref:hypothetical protein n=1 Tax=Scytonema sp. UIC 10036 TaxID=2304196 RepID=UPI0012DACF19|nr:hypothetical protein [Scytonema sp. UIC 10036]MUG97457.1 hypothetical protein [Scytonema sp. UIC 10036]
MNLPSYLQKEIEKWASSQGISVEEFIVQTITEKINQLNQYIEEPSLKEPLTYYEDRILVVDAPLPKDFDLVAFIDEVREERIQELMSS